MGKSTVTRTMGPIHFEDLEPHRFEDLVRELLYDYKDWQLIEATGRVGSDEGFDVRAYEKSLTTQTSADEIDDDVPGLRPMEGNLWMIQCKREKEIGPSAVQSIINENIKKESVPYGYILVAPANFSKKSYDTFREVLISIGVMEFYLWGRAVLEDMLHMPKYDRILFTFFGISLISRQRSRSTELRSRIAIKNKLYSVLGEEDPVAHTPILIRDFNDNEYPFAKTEQQDDNHPGWLKCNFTANHVHGLWVEIAEYYGYYNEKKKEWDIATGFDISKLYEEGETEGEFQDKMTKNERYRNFWERLPHANRVELSEWGHLDYEDIILVDVKGDPLNKMVHIYLDFSYNRTPFNRIIYVTREKQLIKTDTLQRVEIFPANIPEIKQGKVYQDKQARISDNDLKLLDNKFFTKALFDTGKKYSFLNVGDRIKLTGNSDQSNAVWIEITNKIPTNVSDYVEANPSVNALHFIKSQLGDDIDSDKKINVYEFKVTY